MWPGLKTPDKGEPEGVSETSILVSVQSDLV